MYFKRNYEFIWWRYNCWYDKDIITFCVSGKTKLLSYFDLLNEMPLIVAYPHLIKARLASAFIKTYDVSYLVIKNCYWIIIIAYYLTFTVSRVCLMLFDEIWGAKNICSCLFSLIWIKSVLSLALCLSINYHIGISLLKLHKMKYMLNTRRKPSVEEGLSMN